MIRAKCWWFICCNTTWISQWFCSFEIDKLSRFFQLFLFDIYFLFIAQKEFYYFFRTSIYFKFDIKLECKSMYIVRLAKHFIIMQKMEKKDKDKYLCLVVFAEDHIIFYIFYIFHWKLFASWPFVLITNTICSRTKFKTSLLDSISFGRVLWELELKAR